MAHQDPASTTKDVVACPPRDYAATAPTGGTDLPIIDTLGFRWAKFTFHTGAVAGTSIDLSIEDDTDSAFGSGAAITGADFTQILTGSDDQIESIVLDLSFRDRYLRLAWTFNTMTASEVCVNCSLSGIEDSTELGAENVATITHTAV